MLALGQEMLEIVSCYLVCGRSMKIKRTHIFLAHLSLQAHKVSLQDTNAPAASVRCRPQCSNIFSSETARTIKAKFHVEPPWEGGTKVYINGPGHMTKMAAMLIYGKNL